MEKHELPGLGYGYAALEPYIDMETMKMHHMKHHQAYVDNLNAALDGHWRLSGKKIEDIVSGLAKVPENLKEAVRNHGGGHANHSFFWKVLEKGSVPESDVLEKLKDSFGSFKSFKDQFSKAAKGLFGSGWVWLVADRERLKIMVTRNQDSPLTVGKIPVLGLDVWEHAYYLQYQNRRPEYIEAFFKVINWERVAENLEKGSKGKVAI